MNVKKLWTLLSLDELRRGRGITNGITPFAVKPHRIWPPVEQLVDFLLVLCMLTLIVPSWNCFGYFRALRISISYFVSCFLEVLVFLDEVLFNTDSHSQIIFEFQGGSTYA